ncbi:MAG: DUF1501 domain-containing protein [Planctomycetota bacterium]
MHDNNSRNGCRGYNRLQLSRRNLLRNSVVAGSALWLTHFAESLARAADSDKNSQPKSLLFIWLQGGPSQLETFDPHPGTSTGGDTKAIATSIPGVQISDFMPATAEQLHNATLIRSVISKEGDHERASYHLKTGWRPDPTIVHPAIGAIVCHESESNLEIPRHISIEAGQWPARGGYLGAGLDAFQIGDPAKPIPNLTAAVDSTRMNTRVNSLLNVVESEFQRGRLKELNQKRTLHETATSKAIKMMSSEQLTAFDVKQESESTLASFGDTSFGRGCLAGIRLLQSGVRCVEIELSGWDSHINNHELQGGQATILDRALAATLQELGSRDMLDSTVVFCGGEFGRTPRINPASGRDHWPHGFSTLLAGGKFRRGYVHGETAANPDPELLRRNGETALDPTKLTSDCITVPELHASLLSALGIDASHEMDTPIGRPLRWSDAQPSNVLFQS